MLFKVYLGLDVCDLCILKHIFGHFFMPGGHIRSFPLVVGYTFSQKTKVMTTALIWRSVGLLHQYQLIQTKI